MSGNNDARISPNAIHGEKIIAITLEKHNSIVNELKGRIKELETELYFCNRNRRLENIIGSADTVSEKE